MSALKRRDILKSFAGMASALPAWACASGPEPKASPRIVVVGGGFGGASVLRYLAMLLPNARLFLVEPQTEYVSCPMSNAAIGGLLPYEDLVFAYAGLERKGVQHVRQAAKRIDYDRQELILNDGAVLPFDRLVTAPGVKLLWGSPEAYDPEAAQVMPHAWKAGAQTRLLARQLQSLGDGSTIAISVPARPFRCPPGPYERASLMAAWLNKHRRGCKVLILDSNSGFAKQALFQQAWDALYPGMIEWRPVEEDGAVNRVDATKMTVYTELDELKFDLVNLIPAQSAGQFALDNDLSDKTGWCPIEAGTARSVRHPKVHVLGDAALAGAMPKSASAANSQAKNCALALAHEFTDRAAPQFSFHNTCYSLLDTDYGISVNMRYAVNEEGLIAAVPGAGGVSPKAANEDYRRAEAHHTYGWFRSIGVDSFG